MNDSHLLGFVSFHLVLSTAEEQPKATQYLLCAEDCWAAQVTRKDKELPGIQGELGPEGLWASNGRNHLGLGLEMYPVLNEREGTMAWTLQRPSDKPCRRKCRLCIDEELDLTSASLFLRRGAHRSFSAWRRALQDSPPWLQKHLLPFRPGCREGYRH